MPRGQFQGVLDSERFILLRTLEFFANFGDVELWEVVHRAKWQRFHFGHALYRKGEEGNSFHIIAQGEVEVFRDGKKVAQLGAGTSVGEMAYLAPSAELKKHSTDVIVTEPATTISFTPDTLLQLSPERAAPVPRLVHQGARAAAARGARGAGASAPDLLAPLGGAGCGACRLPAARPWSNPPAPRARGLTLTETSMKQLITLSAPGPGALDLGVRQLAQGSARMAATAGAARRWPRSRRRWATATEKKLARATAQEQLHEEVRRADAAAACDAQAAEKKLAGAAKTSFTARSAIADRRIA